MNAMKTELFAGFEHSEKVALPFPRLAVILQLESNGQESKVRFLLTLYLFRQNTLRLRRQARNFSTMMEFLHYAKPSLYS